MSLPVIFSSDGSLSVTQIDCLYDLKLPKASPSGFSLSTSPSPSFLFNGNGTTLPLIGTVRLSQASGNTIIQEPDGLYVGLQSFTETLLSVVDTPTINLTASGLSAHTLQADLKVSTLAGNALTVRADGIYVSPIAVGGGYTDAQARNSISALLPLVYNSVTGVLSTYQASGTQAGHLSSADWVTFFNKEPAISLGNSSQYWRGDKTWQVLNTTAVPEGLNQYFTAVRARNSISALAPLSYNSITGVMSEAVATNSQDGYLSSTDWVLFSSKVVDGTSLASVGGFGIYKDKTAGSVLEFRGIKAGIGITLNLVGDDVIINGSGTVPVVNAGADQSVVLPTTSVTLTGTATTAAGTITSTNWHLMSGPSTFNITDAASLSTVVTGLVAGNYVFRLTAVNSFGLVSTDDVLIIVSGSVVVLDTIYIGTNTTGFTPTQSQILAAVSSTQNGALNVNADWISQTAAAPVFCFFAIPDGGAAFEKNKWFVDVLNNGNIGSPSDLFGALTVVNVSGNNYSVGITNYATQFVGVCQLQKV